MKKNKKRNLTLKEIKDYDSQETSVFVNQSNPIKLEDLNLRIPQTPPTQVISIRLPSELLNEIKALGSQSDIPYQALIKLFLSESVAKTKKKSA